MTLIGADWGTTNLRVFRFDAEGRVAETRRSAQGMAHVEKGGFEAALMNLVADWAPERVLISGMAGAREGWFEAPYIPCPAGAAELAANLACAPAVNCEAWIVPGLKAERTDGIVEVMRGEETQIVGAMQGTSPMFVVAPGTHSKWTRLSGGKIQDSRTYMTGEMFALLKRHSILARMMDGDAHDPDAFALGVERGLSQPELLNLLFSVRTEGLFAHIAPHALAAYLSGVLIGAEVMQGFATQISDSHDPILIVAAAEIAALYGAALKLAGEARVDTVDGEAAAARGLWRIAQARGFV